MRQVKLSWVARAIGAASLPTQVADQQVSAVTIDSRQVPADSLFLALRGPNFDGHNFAADAVAAGAKAVVAEKPLELGVPQLLVADTRIALGQLGQALKYQQAPRTIALTGSSGKTSVKEMVATILRREHQVLATQGNYNNDIGVPLTLLGLTAEHTHLVAELGANHRGEIRYTSGLVQPDVALITNVGAAHVEGFGGICGVLQAKTEIFTGLQPGGVALTNADDQFHDFWQRELRHLDHRTFGSAESGADYRACEVKLDADGCASFELRAEQQQYFVRLPLPGQHNVANALAATAACRALGVSFATIVAGLQELAPVPGRMQVSHPRPGFTLVDDSYNANVASAKAAIDMLVQLAGRRILVLGDMGELGKQARAYHEEVGDYAKQAGIDGLYTLGVLSQSASETFNGHGGRHFASRSELVTALQQDLQHEQHLSILVKGSRSARMEAVVAALADPGSTGEEAQAC